MFLPWDGYLGLLISSDVREGGIAGGRIASVGTTPLCVCVCVCVCVYVCVHVCVCMCV